MANNLCSVQNVRRKNAFDYAVEDMKCSSGNLPLVNFDWSKDEVEKYYLAIEYKADFC